MYRLLVILIIGLSTTLAQANTTTLRQQRIHEGDIAELTIEYQATIPSLYAIDTTPLLADFRVLDTRSQISRVQQSQQTMHRMQWRVTLLPRRSGRLRIPALGYGDYLSEVLWLEVERADPESARQDAFIELEAIPQNPYPGQQTRIVMRMLHDWPSLEGSLVEPRPGQGRVYHGERDRRYSINRKSRPFSVVERSILITPESAGSLTLAPASFTGVASMTAAAGLETTARDQRYIFRESDALELQLRAPPATFTGIHWLPAQALEIELEWDALQRPLQVGDSIGVTLTLQAIGLPGEALPSDLLLRDARQYYIYADQPERDTRVEGSAAETRLIGQLRQRYALVVDQAGELLLPELRLPWWDVGLDRARVATLQAVRLKVAAASAQDPGGHPGDRRHAAGMGAGLQSGSLSLHWPWLIAALALVSGIGLLFTASGLRNALLDRTGRMLQRRLCLRRLQRACRDNDAAAARRALLAWARIHWKDPRISGTHSIGLHGGTPDWRLQLQSLDAALFSAEPGDWRGRQLWQLVRRQTADRAGRAAGRTARLPGLYPG